MEDLPKIQDYRDFKKMMEGFGMDVKVLPNRTTYIPQLVLFKNGKIVAELPMSILKTEEN